MGRITDTFDRLRREERTGLVAYITAGDPTLARTEDILHALERAGADLIELGVPFSDPLADGPVIQRATERALAGGTTLDDVITLVGRVRGSLTVPSGSAGSIGRPSLASAEKGKRIYERIYSKISDRIFLAPSPSE